MVCGRRVAGDDEIADFVVGVDLVWPECLAFDVVCCDPAVVGVFVVEGWLPVVWHLAAEAWADDDVVYRGDVVGGDALERPECAGFCGCGVGEVEVDFFAEFAGGGLE